MSATVSATVTTLEVSVASFLNRTGTVRLAEETRVDVIPAFLSRPESRNRYGSTTR